MKPDDLIRQLDQSQFSPVYFLFGEERFYHTEIISAFSRKIITPENREFNFTKFDSLGNPFEPVVLGGGDVLRVKDLGTGAEADVVFYIRDGLNGVIFVKNTTGTFKTGFSPNSKALILNCLSVLNYLSVLLEK